MIVLEFERRCWAEVDLGALRHNFELVRRAADGAAVIAVVKADAYGHGDAAVARVLEAIAAAGFEGETQDTKEAPAEEKSLSSQEDAPWPYSGDPAGQGGCGKSYQASGCQGRPHQESTGNQRAAH